MVTKYTFYKNSNTGEVMKAKEYTDTSIKGIPIYYYDLSGKSIGENLNLNGFTVMGEKQWNRLKRKYDAKNKS
jgi:hypothetical protein